MASLTDKLKELGVQVGTSQLKTPATNHHSTRSLIDVLPGSWESTSGGDCFVVRKTIPFHTKHGLRNLKGLPSMEFFEALDHLKGISAATPEEFLFIDTETTGLSGGAGTYVFLVGVAKYEKDSLNFAQFFLQDPQSESAQLSALERYVADAKVIVSYNGKSFDLPRIKSRYRFHGWPNPFENIYHIDLLHIARRLWKPHLPGCTLGDLEEHIIGLQRDNLDIPGWQISEFFYEYMQSGDPSPLENIFYHNEVDVISLAALLEYIADRLSIPLSKEFKNEPDLVSIGNYFYSLHLFSEAQAILTTALSNPDLSGAILLKGKLSLAAIHKRRASYDLAVPIWKECAELGSFDALIELAKYAEHKLFDFEEALHWTLSAYDSLHIFPPSKRAAVTSLLDHRLRRLKIKVKR